MPVTTLDAKTALLLIDLQKGILSNPLVHSGRDVLRNARELADAFRGRGLPVVLVNVTGGAPGRSEQPRSTVQRAPDWAELVPELDKQPGDLTVTKRTWGAFASTDLDARLRALGVTQVVIGGISTSIGVESTARHAYALGYNVTLAVDAMTDTNLDAHTNSVTRIFPRLGETGTTREIVGLVARS